MSTLPLALSTGTDLTDPIAILVIAVGLAGAAILILFAKRKI